MTMPHASSNLSALQTSEDITCILRLMKATDKRSSIIPDLCKSYVAYKLHFSFPFLEW